MEICLPCLDVCIINWFFYLKYQMNLIYLHHHYHSPKPHITILVFFMTNLLILLFVTLFYNFCAVTWIYWSDKPWVSSYAWCSSKYRRPYTRGFKWSGWENNKGYGAAAEGCRTGIFQQTQGGCQVWYEIFYWRLSYICTLGTLYTTNLTYKIIIYQDQPNICKLISITKSKMNWKFSV